MTRRHAQAEDPGMVSAAQAMAALPLFDERGQPHCNCPGEGPFARSKVAPSPEETVVASLIWHRTRAYPISIADIIRQMFEMAGARVRNPHNPLPRTAAPGSEREIKAVVAALRLTHHCAIGASRQSPIGYFWIRTAEDREVAVQPYREQIFTMLRTLRALDSKQRLLELLGQMQLEVENEGDHAN